MRSWALRRLSGKGMTSEIMMLDKISTRFWRAGSDAGTMTKLETWAATLISSICWELQIISRLLKTSLKKPKSSCKQRESTCLVKPMSCPKMASHRKSKMHMASICRITKINRDISSTVQTRKLVATWANKKLQVHIQTPSCTELTSTWTSFLPHNKKITIKCISRTKTMCHHFTTTMLKREKMMLNRWGYQTIRQQLDAKETRAASRSGRRSRCSSRSCKSCKCISSISNWAARNSIKTGTATWAARVIPTWTIAAYSVMKAQG